MTVVVSIKQAIKDGFAFGGLLVNAQHKRLIGRRGAKSLVGCFKVTYHWASK